MVRMLVLALIVLSPLSVGAGLENQLRNHPSPYLAMHGGDPVHWQAWGSEALAKAQATNRLLFISSGYFACHWCHVMQQESYRNPQVAALLNAHFIPVKVDRELQPALDAHLIEFVQRTRGSAGWPLNVFLTPGGYPLVGLTYAPQENFLRFLQRLKEVWAEQAGPLAATARQASQVPEQPSKSAGPTNPDPAALHRRLVEMALSLGDDMEGGFGQQSRFPMSPQWSVLLSRLEQVPNDALRELVVLTLDQMAGQGMRDHLGGGFFRYTVDPGWQVPHFEKMLYTQALLARLYLQAASVLNRPDYLEVARDTLDFSLAVLPGVNGGFIASLSAVDEQNIEGGGYLWTSQRLSQILDPDELAFAQKRWRLEGVQPIEGGYLPVQGVRPAVLARQRGETLEQLRLLERGVREKLLAARAPRDHPRDEKQLAAWNGLMLSALIDGYRVLEDERYRAAASRLRDYLVTQLWTGEQLLRARGDAGPLGNAALEDYVYVAKALRDWAELTGSDVDLELSRVLQEAAWRRFFRAAGWQSTDQLLLPGITLEPAVSDGPLPSPAAMLVEMSLTSEAPQMREYARQAIALGRESASGQPLWYATQVGVSIDAASAATTDPGG